MRVLTKGVVVLGDIKGMESNGRCQTRFLFVTDTALRHSMRAPCPNYRRVCFDYRDRTRTSKQHDNRIQVCCQAVHGTLYISKPNTSFSILSCK